MSFDEPTGPARQAVLPATLSLTSLGRRLEISRRWSPLILWLLPAVCCCFGPCGIFGEGLVSGSVRQMDNGRFVGYLKIPWLGYLMMAVAVLGSAVLVYLLLASFVNRTVLRVEPGRLRVFNTPLPWPPGSLELSPEDIAHFESTPGLRVKQGSRDVVKPMDIMVVVDRQGRRRQLVPGLESQAQLAWLEAEIRRTLGMPAPATGSWPQQAPEPESLSVAVAQPSAEVQEPGMAPPAEERSPRGLSGRLGHALIAHVLGYVSATQQVFAVGGHFGWLMMVIIGLQEGGAGGAGRTLSRGLLTLYERLGGVNEHGRGGTGEMMEVWGKVALIIYAVEVLLSWVRGPRRPWSLRRVWAASTLLACAGYGLAFALLAGSKAGGRIGEMLGVMLFCVGFTSVMTLWALGVGKFVRTLQQQIRGAPGQGQ